LGEVGLKGFEPINPAQAAFLRSMYIGFNEEDALRVKEIERTTNHDVKAVEYFIKEKLKGTEFESRLEYIHFGLTSQDINNTAIPLSIKHYHEEVFIPLWKKFIDTLRESAEEWKNVPMLAKTHGQPASPTKLGKEIMVFVERFEKQIQILQ